MKDKEVIFVDACFFNNIGWVEPWIYANIMSWVKLKNLLIKGGSGV